MLSPPQLPLQSGAVEPKMKFITQAQVERLIQLYYPLWRDGAISLRTLLSLLPDIDPEKETRQSSINSQGVKNEE